MNRPDRARILVCDDDRNVRAVARLRLRASGYDVLEAEDGKTALELVGKGGIDVVVLDAMMPEMDGFEVLDRMQELEHHPSVLFLTALDKNNSRVRKLYGGAVDYLGKPFEPAEFLERIAAAVKKHRLIRGAIEEVSAKRLDREKGVIKPSGMVDARLAHLVPRMIADMNIAHHAMENAAEKGDLKRIEALGHRMKGTSGVFEYHVLSELGGAIEASAQARDMVETRKLIKKLALHLEELQASPARP